MLCPFFGDMSKLARSRDFSVAAYFRSALCDFRPNWRKQPRLRTQAPSPKWVQGAKSPGAELEAAEASIVLPSPINPNLLSNQIRAFKKGLCRYPAKRRIERQPAACVWKRDARSPRARRWPAGKSPKPESRSTFPKCFSSSCPRQMQDKRRCFTRFHS